LKGKFKQLEEYYEQEKDELEIRLKRSKEKCAKLKEKLKESVDSKEEISLNLVKFEEKINQYQEQEKVFKEELKEKQIEKVALEEKIVQFEEKQEKLWEENNYLKKTNDLKDGYDQMNILKPPSGPPPPPLNMPKKGMYPSSFGGGMSDLLAEIKKGFALRRGEIVGNDDFQMPVEVDIAEQCAKGLNGLRKTAWRKSMQRGDPVIIEIVKK
jgi:glutamyl/glutaminyl-tRNA synthetase